MIKKLNINQIRIKKLER